jgi:hypothetical protein
MNTSYFERIAEQAVLEKLSLIDLKNKIKQETGVDCDIAFRKNCTQEEIIKIVLEEKYGQEIYSQIPGDS